MLHSHSIRPSLIFHIGLHKTATTLVQRIMHMIDAQPQRAHVHPENAQYQPLRDQLLRFRNTGQDRDNVKAALPHFLTSFDGHAQILISDENVIGQTPFGPGSQTEGYAYPKLEQQIQLIDFLFNDYDLHYLVTLRNEIDFIYSLYCDGLKYGRYSFTFSEYVRRLDISSFSMEMLKNRILEATDNNVQFLRSDLLKDRPQEFLAEFFPDVSDDTLAHFATSRVNTSMNKSRLTISRLFGGYSYEDRKKLRAWLASCPVGFKDSGLSFLDVALDEESRSYISFKLNCAKK